MLQGVLEGAEDPEAGDQGEEYVYDEDGNLTEYINEGSFQDQLDEQQLEDFPGEDEGKRTRPDEVRIINGCSGAHLVCITKGVPGRLSLLKMAIPICVELGTISELRRRLREHSPALACAGLPYRDVHCKASVHPASA
jgi:hypothetical protein